VIWRAIHSAVGLAVTLILPVFLTAPLDPPAPPVRVCGRGLRSTRPPSERSQGPTAQRRFAFRFRSFAHLQAGIASTPMGG
jgi:hypothetical protein